MKFFLFIVAVVFTYTTHAQTCSCENKFEWVKKTFEENDAGFQYVIDKKGKAAYDVHNHLMLEKIKAVNTSAECVKLMNEWLRFFRSGHVSVEHLTDNTYVTSSQTAVQAAQDIETWEEDLLPFEKYLSGKKSVDYEGVWQSGAYKIGIRKNGANYIGFIIESGVDEWKPGQVKLKIEQEGDKVKSTFFMRDHSPLACESELIGNNYMLIAGQMLKRLSPILQNEPFLDNYYKYLNTQSPYLDTLNETTLYLRIPSFDRSKQAIDKILADNKDKILKTENLIIDLRNNGGGDDDSFSELLPILYTNPIHTISVEFLSTKQNNQRFLEFATTTEYDFDEKTRQWMRDSYDKLEQHLNEFVRLQGNLVDSFPEVHLYPKNVGIIINGNCVSSTEQFLLAAKQSKKVKLFGTTTFGALDISNMYSIESSCKEFRLNYCLSRSLRIPNFAIDDIGIQPDYYLDKTIPQHKWVEAVNEILNQ